MTNIKIIRQDKPFTTPQERLEAYKHVFNSELGSKVLSDISIYAGMTEMTLSQSEREAYQREGMRYVVNRILSILDVRDIKTEDQQQDI